MAVQIHHSVFQNKPKAKQEEKKKSKAKSKPPSAVIFRDRSNEGRSSRSSPRPAAKPVGPPATPAEEALAAIREAMQVHKVLTFQYIDHSGLVTARTVEPYKLAQSAVGDIVLYGYCLEKDAIRLFKISAMQECRVDVYDFAPRFPVEDLLDSAKKSK